MKNWFISQDYATALMIFSVYADMEPAVAYMQYEQAESEEHD